MRRINLAAAISTVAAATMLVAPVTPLAPGLGAQTIAITGGTVYTVSGAPIQNGTVLIRGGKIVAVGANVTIPGDAQRIDATGKMVTPGLIDAGTTLGLVELGGESSTRDVDPRGTNEISASVRVWEGLNSESANWASARNEGITDALVSPNGGLVAGQAAIVTTNQSFTTSMVIRGPVAMIAQIDDPNAAGTGARGELLAKLRELLSDAKFYQAHRPDYDRASSRTLSAPRGDLEAMIPVVEGKLPLAIDANSANDIEGALKLARDFKLRIIITGGAEAWMVANDLAAAHVPVVTGAMSNIPNSFQTLNTRQENLGILAKAGVETAVVGNAGGGDEDGFNVRNVKYEAGNAISYGMSRDAALRAVTLGPAEIFGVADRIGSLQPGRDANVVIWSGDPFEFSTHVEHVYVEGKEVVDPSRQDMLTKRYKTLPPSYKSGQ